MGGELATEAVPPVYRDEVIGIIALGERRRPKRYTRNDVLVLRAIADHAAIAIANARLNRPLEEQATTDPLTGLRNRRHLQDWLLHEVATAHRYDHDVSVLILDVDDFKSFNDAYGHLQGDQLLRELTTILTAETRRDVDLVSRYGGDEFVVVTPRLAECAAAGVSDCTVAKRHVAVVASRQFERSEEQREAHAIVSVGLAALGDVVSSTATDKTQIQEGHDGRTAHDSDHVLTVDALLCRADEALYSAKRRDKNRVWAYERRQAERRGRRDRLKWRRRPRAIASIGLDLFVRRAALADDHAGDGADDVALAHVHHPDALRGAPVAADAVGAHADDHAVATLQHDLVSRPTCRYRPRKLLRADTPAAAGDEGERP